MAMSARLALISDVCHEQSIDSEQFLESGMKPVGLWR